MVALSDVMTPDVVTLSAEASVGEAAKVMVRGGFGSVVVVQGRMLLGILTERDVLRAAAGQLPSVSNVPLLLMNSFGVPAWSGVAWHCHWKAPVAIPSRARAAARARPYY